MPDHPLGADILDLGRAGWHLRGTARRMTGARAPAGPPNGRGSPALSGPVSAAAVSSTAAPTATPPHIARQRWRLYLRMPAARLPGEVPAGSGAWASLLERCGLPLAGEPGRGRVVPAAQLPLGISGEREFLDVILAARLPAVEVRARVQAALPPNVELVDLHDVWVGAPSASAALVAADYRVELAGVPALELRMAADALLAASSLPRERRREKKTQSFDLRPLIVTLSVSAVLPPAGVGLDVLPPAGTGPETPTSILRTRLRHRPDAAGRPEDVVEALGSPPAPPLPAGLRVLRIIRERLLSAGEA